MSSKVSDKNEPTHAYLIDDDPDDRLLVCQAFTQIHPEIKIVEAVDGLHFFELFESGSQDLPLFIVLDGNMPRMNGLEALAKIKSTPSLARVPVVMFSTSNDPSLIMQAYQNGIATFIHKPTSFEGLIEFASLLSSRYVLYAGGLSDTNE